jgi:hypothetical protein
LKKSKTPKSLYEAVGWSLPNDGVVGRRDYGPLAPFTPANATKQFGTVYFDSVDVNPCPVSSVYSSGSPFTTLFDRTFTTGLAQTAVKVVWSGQVNIDTPPPGGFYDGVFMVCQYKQGAGAFSSCPGFALGPALLTTAGTTVGTNPIFLGQTAFVGFSTVLSGLLPDTSTTVQLLVTSFTSQGLAYSVCSQNLLIEQ